jgi:hypothetical protein
MKKLTKETCLPGTKAAVHNGKSRLNEVYGTEHNGLVCFPFNPKDKTFGEELELIPGSEITIQSKPKRVDGSSHQVNFTVDGDPTTYSAWWITIKAKVEIL